ncbi:SulP family inorganic anion transporter [Novosphingobium sp. SG720]|uniref:SulP family inorganic anion transporter n=1 Tax=Novosphingobium sp. SG720 TaxID=2586998 RepID=UPI0014462827|nr:SulP family inorganic anion transporter [Novosphingobium sp. SG720]NKJ41309.1 MFS superfamily sulfate permease-like transporter [Novosphingobium sp. SG720]
MAFTVRNALAGLAMAGLMLPEAVAYAGIAGLAPGRALIAAVAGGLAYALVGRSRFAVVSPTSSSAAILAASLGSLVAGPGGAAATAANATALTLLAGGLFIALAAARLGSLAGFIARPVLRGFALGLALTIIIRQLPAMTGVPAPPGTVGAVAWAVLEQMPHWHVATLACGLGALVLLLLLRCWPGVPGALIVLVLGIAGASLPGFARLGIAQAGPTPLVLSMPVLPADPAQWLRLVPLAVPLVLILFAESWGTIRSLALARGDALNANRELAALGLANTAAALAQGMPVGAGFSAGSANAASGATSRAAGVMAALALLALALWAGPLTARLPQPVLAAVVMAALAHALSPEPLLRPWKLGRDRWTAPAAALGVLALGVLDGLLLAVGLSLAQLLYRLAHPSLSELGQISQGHDFVDRAAHPEAAAVPGVAIYRPNAPLFFANAETVLALVARRAQRPGAPVVVVLSLEESDDLDSTAAEVIGELHKTLAARQGRLILARTHDRARAVLAAAGLDDLARNATFSVADAVALAQTAPAGH